MVETVKGLVIMLIIAFMVITVGRCTYTPPKPLPPLAYEVGGCAAMKLDGKEGMVLSRYNHRSGQRYEMRFNTPSVFTDARWGDDGKVDVRPYTTMFVSDFELKACE